MLATPSFDALQPGDRIALCVPGTSAYVELCLRLLDRGVFPVPLDPKLTAYERTAILDDINPAITLDSPEQVQALLDEVGRGAPPLDGLVPRGRPMHVTSGTTGRPKAVFSGLLSSEAGQALLAEERELWGFAESDVNLVVSPLHHSAPLRFAMGTRSAGGRIVVPGPFDVVRLTETIRSERPTTMFVVPTHLQRLFAHWDQTGWPDLSSFRLVAHAGAPCPTAIKHRMIATFPAGATWEFYGSTEGQFTACRSEEWLDRPGTVGRARPGRQMSVDEDGHLWCVVPEHARFSYWNAPEKTAQAWRDTPGGPAFTVGDLGRIDEEGYVWLDGRRVDLIISGGVNVYPLEVESVLHDLDGVEDIAVYGTPDTDWGQRVCAAVVGSVSEESLRAYAAERLAPAKRPKEYVFLTTLPRTATGKVRRHELDRLDAKMNPCSTGTSPT